jgi:hypothetical protein
MSGLFKGEAGVDFVRLTGQNNFSRWIVDFQMVAESKNLWKVFDGTEEVLKPPYRDAYLKPTAEVTVPHTDSRGKATRSKVTATVAAELLGQTGPSDPSDDLQVRIHEYKFDLDAFQANDKLVREAKTFIAYWVDDAIRGTVQSFKNPKDAFDYLVSQYKMNDARALHLALGSIEQLKLADFDSISAYLNEHQKYQRDIINVGGTYSEDQMTAKIIRNLGPKYDTFLNLLFLQDDSSIDLKTLTTQLLTYESKLQERAVQHKQSDHKQAKDGRKDEGQNIKKEKGDNRGDGRGDSRDKCTVCGKWRHTEATCWEKHPHLKKEFDDKKKKKKSGNGFAGMTQADATTLAGAFAKVFADMKLPGMLTTLQKPTQDPADLTSQETTNRRKAVGSSGLEGQAGGGSVPEDDAHAWQKWRTTASRRLLDVLFPPNRSSFLVKGGDQLGQDTWLADGGANAHIVNDIKWFSSFRPFQMGINTAEGTESMLIKGGGSMVLPLEDKHGRITQLKLTKVVYAPSSRCNLLSLTEIAKKSGLRGHWGEDKLTFETREGVEIGHALTNDGLYHVSLAPQPHLISSRVKHAAMIDFNDPVWKWHRRLGHISFENLRRLLKQSEGIDITDQQVKAKLKAICPVCATTRATVRIPRDPASRRFEEVGDLLHVDTWGPYPVLGWDSTKYLLFATDDATRFTWCVSVSDKDELPRKVQRLVRKIQKEYKTVVRSMRLDNEIPRYSQFTHWIEKHGITLEPTAPHAHHQAGVAERNHRTVRDKASAMVGEHSISGQITNIIAGKGTEMLMGSSIPEKVWPEALKHATWLKNRSPTRALKSNKTPWEAVKGAKPNMERERIWGSRAYVTYAHSDKRRNGPKVHTRRGWVGYYMGCESDSICLIWDPATETVKRISMARVEDGEGLDDRHQGPSLTHRIHDSSAEKMPSQELSLSLDDHDAAHQQTIDTRKPRDYVSTQEEEFSLPFPSSETPSKRQIISISTDESASAHDRHTQDLYFPHQYANNSGHGDGVPWDAQTPPETSDVSVEGWGIEPRSPPTPTFEGDADYDGYMEPDDGFLTPIDEVEDFANDADDEDIVEGDIPRVRSAFLARKHSRTGKFQRRSSEDEESNYETSYSTDGYSTGDSDIRALSGRRSKKYKTSDVSKKQGGRRRSDSETDNNLPDHKCDYCARTFQACLGGVPCARCTANKRKCIPQTKATKALNHVKAPYGAPLITVRTQSTDWYSDCGCHIGRCTHGKNDHYCKQCRKNQRRHCDGKTPCDQCTKRGLQDKCAQPKARLKEEDKCHPCFIARRACDGGKPCSYCKKFRPTQPCLSQDEFASPKCTFCKSSGGGCDRKRPCNRCIKTNKTCNYSEKFTWNQYGTKPAKIPEQSDEECFNCVQSKMRHACDRGAPCTRCVSLASDSHRYCRYRHTDGRVERFDTAMYVTKTAPGVIVGPFTDLRSNFDYENNMLNRGQPKRRGRPVGEVRPTDEDASPDDAQSASPSTWSRPNPLDGADQMNAPLLFEQAFPNGYEVIPTSSQGLRCGFYAAINSLVAQHPDIATSNQTLAPPTIDDLMEVFRSPEFTQWQAGFSLSNEDNFYVDQVAAVLHFWADTYRDHNVQLGYVLQGTDPVLLRFDDEGTARADVWIYNDNHEARGRGMLNHFSALRHRPATTQAQGHVAPTGGASDKWASDTSSDEDDPEQPIDEDLSEVEEAQHTTSKYWSHAMIAQTVDLATSPDPQTYAQAMRAQDATRWTDSIKVEHDSLIQNHAYDIMDLPSGKRALTSRFVFKRKIGADGRVTKNKARMVARGFQQVQGIDFQETYAAVVKTASYRVLFALAARFNWKIHQMDVKTAYLNGDLDEEIYVHPPEGFPVELPKGKVLRLRKALYGLKQSARSWYSKFANTLLQKGWRVSAFDPCIFIHDEKQLFQAVYVDDVIMTGPDEDQIIGFKGELSEEFAMTDEGRCSYFLGMNVQQGEHSIQINQSGYAQQIINRYGLRDLPRVSTPIDHNVKLSAEKNTTADPKFRTEYQSMVGALNWLSIISRPDISHAVTLAARYNSNPNRSHLNHVLRIFGYLQGTLNMGLSYCTQQPLTGYVDSDWGGCADTGRSTTGWVFMLSGAPVSWSSQRQKTVSLSTCEAEYVAAAEAAKEAVWLKGFINDLNVPYAVTKVPLLIDNNSALKLSRNPEFHGRTKHIALKHHFLREKVEEGEIETARIGTKDNLSDILTKGLPKIAHEDLRTRLGVSAGTTATYSR